MKTGNSGYYSFRKITRRHYAEIAKKCGITPIYFDKVMAELQEAYENLSICDKELDPKLNHETLDIILEGMKERNRLLFASIT